MMVERIECFSSLENYWNELLGSSETKTKTIFQTYEWLSTWWKHFGSVEQAYLLVAKDGSDVIGIAALMCVRYSVKGFPLFRVVQFIGSGVSDYLQFILKQGREYAVMEAFVEYLIGDRENWDIIRLSEVPEDSPSGIYLQEVLKRKGLKFLSQKMSDCPYIELPFTWEEYFHSLGRTTKKNVKMYSKRLSREGTVEHRIICETKYMPEAISDFFALHEGRWKGDEKGHARSEEIKAFHRDVSVKLSGHAHIYFLMLNQRQIAAMYCYDYGSTRYFYWMGWDKYYAHCSPGFIAITSHIRDAIEKGFRRFDFLRGDEQYKYYFTKAEKKNMRYFISYSGVKLKILLFLERLAR